MNYLLSHSFQKVKCKKRKIDNNEILTPAFKGKIAGKIKKSQFNKRLINSIE